MSKRELAASLLCSRVMRPLWRAGYKGRSALRILAYHRVLDEDPATFPFDDELISATPEAFHDQMQFVRRHFQVVSFADLYACEQEGKAWPERALIVTFDDGYADNYTNAWPILKELNLPATIFLATAFMESNQLFWWDLVAYCFKKSPLATAHFPEIGQPLSLGDTTTRRKAINQVLHWIKDAPDDEKNAFLERLPSVLEVSVPADAGRNMRVSWPQVQEMAAQGVEFGAHSVTHPMLTNITPHHLEQEVTNSKLHIETRLGQEILAFCYPAGRLDEDVKSVVQRAGFHYAAAYHEGIINKTYNRYSLPRIHVEHDHSFALFRSNLLFPGIMLRNHAVCWLA